MPSPWSFSFEPLFVALAAAAVTLYVRAWRAAPGPWWRAASFAGGVAPLNETGAAFSPRRDCSVSHFSTLFLSVAISPVRPSSSVWSSAVRPLSVTDCAINSSNRADFSVYCVRAAVSCSDALTIPLPVTCPETPGDLVVRDGRPSVPNRAGGRASRDLMSEMDAC